MKTTVGDIMVRSVISTTAHRSVGSLRRLMKSHGIHSVPVLGANGEPRGIFTTSDLLRARRDEAPVGHWMTRDVQTVPAYEDVGVAARLMRKHHIHHLVVTHEQKVIGIISSFDLLALLEGRRYVPREAARAPKMKGRPRSGRRLREL